MHTNLTNGLGRGTGASGVAADHHRAESDYVFHELTRSICPNCRRVIDALVGSSFLRWTAPGMIARASD